MEQKCPGHTASQTYSQRIPTVTVKVCERKKHSRSGTFPRPCNGILWRENQTPHEAVLYKSTNSLCIHNHCEAHLLQWNIAEILACIEKPPVGLQNIVFEASTLLCESKTPHFIFYKMEIV